MVARQQNENLQSLCQSGLQITTGMHVLDVYFILQKTDTATGCVTPSLIIMIKPT